MKPHAMALLRSVSREVSADAMKRYVQQVATRLEQQGTSSSTTEKAVKKKVQEPMSSSSQLSGQETVATVSPPPPSAAEASSAHMADLFKSEGARTSAPLAQTQEHELTNGRKAILVNIEENFGYHRQLILLAFERCDSAADQNEVARWCFANQDEYKDEEPMEEEEYSQDMISVHSDKEEEYREGDTVSIMEVTADSTPLPPAEVIARQRVAVDEHHPVVKRLLDLDYPLDKCLDAAERFPEDSHAAYEYLQQTGDIFGEEEVMEWSAVEASRPAVDWEEPAVHVER